MTHFYRTQTRQRPFVWGHRGWPVRHPENSLTGLVEAFRAGADGVECDVRLSRDGVWVVIHDYLTDRTTTLSGAVAERTWPEPRSGRLKTTDGKITSDRIPRLEDVFHALHPKSALNIEIKTPLPSRVPLERLGKLASAADRPVMVSSFDWTLLEFFHRQFPAVPVVPLGSGRWTDWASWLTRLGTQTVHWDWEYWPLPAFDGRAVEVGWFNLPRWEDRDTVHPADAWFLDDLAVLPSGTS